MASYSDWEKEGCPDVVMRAERRVRTLLDACPDSLLDADTERALQAYRQRATKC